MLTPAITALHTTKNNDPKSVKIESLMLSSSAGAEPRHRAPRCENALSVPVREFQANLLLVRRSRRRLVHALLHARLMLGFQLLQLGLLIRRQQLVQLVVNASLLHG